MRMRTMIGVLALGALVGIAAPRPAAAGDFHLSLGFPLPIPVFPAPVVVAPPPPPPVYYGPYYPPVVGFGYVSRPYFGHGHHWGGHGHWKHGHHHGHHWR